MTELFSSQGQKLGHQSHSHKKGAIDVCMCIQCEIDTSFSCIDIEVKVKTNGWT